MEGGYFQWDETTRDREQALISRMAREDLEDDEVMVESYREFVGARWNRNRFEWLRRRGTDERGERGRISRDGRGHRDEEPTCTASI